MKKGLIALLMVTSLFLPQFGTMTALADETHTNILLAENEEIQEEDKSSDEYLEDSESGWSEWSEEIPETEDKIIIQQRTEYRYRTKLTETSPNSSLSGWTYEYSDYSNSSNEYWENWSDYSDTYVAASDTRDVQTKDVVSGYNQKQQWLYTRYYGWSDTKGRYVSYPWQSGSCITYAETGWMDYRLTDTDYNDESGQVCYKKYDDSINIWWWNEQSRWVTDYNSPIYKTQYSYRDKKPTYHFYKWSDWSEWSAEIVSETDSNEVETRIAYRYKVINTSGIEEGIIWNIEDETLIITGAGAIPDYIDYEPGWKELNDYIKHIVIEDNVTSVGTNSFSEMNGVVSITISDTVLAIGDEAFAGCSALKDVKLPDELQSIGNSAFKDCAELQEIVIPESVIVIGHGAFCGCTGLNSITVPFVGSQQGGANSRDVFSYIFDDEVPESLKKVNITNETFIPDNAFKDCNNIEFININNSVINIGVSAFEGCTALKSFKASDGITGIGDNTFRGCENAVAITVPDTVTSIGEGAFDSCKKLTSINIPDGVKYIYNYTFRNCASLKKIEIPVSVISIGEDVLTGCTNLIDIKVPFVGSDTNPGATEVTDNGSFGYLFGCANSEVPASVTKVEITSTDRSGYIPKEAFKNCGNIEDIIIDGGRNILDGAFENCKNLKNLYIPKSISSIGSNILADCTKLETLTIPFIGTNRQDQNTETSVLGSFFGYDDSNITGTIQYYNENNDFHYYKVPRTLKNVSVLNQTTIPAGAFSECDFLEKVAIVTGGSMNRYAFYHCASLKTVTLPNDLQTIGEQAFAECESLETINIPVKVKKIGEQAFYNARSLKNVIMPDSVTEIADDIFNGSNLFSVEDINIMANGSGVITCSMNSAAYNYAVSKGIKTNVVSSDKLDVKKTSTTVTLMSDNTYLFDVTDSYSMKGELHVELYDDEARIVTEKVQTANDVEYRIAFTEADMANVAFAKIYVSEESGEAVSTEDELLYAYNGDIPPIPESDIEMTYQGGVVRFTGTVSVKFGTVLLQAIYNSDDSLAELIIYPITDLDNVTVKDLDGKKAKFMLWNGLEKMKPIANSIEV